ncbi:hypothetical protein [Candidatus Avelusimicrobium fimicolum]|uniref:hypothetical protein n=1 Tax=Candidatus Avelusimicrobium fimicolum TaxID=3416216 RepID=UPI003D0BEEAD
MAISFMQISPAKAVLALALVEQRVSWLETKRIEQWERSHYLSRYNLAYFENAARLGRLWGLFEASRLVASAVLLDKDPRWKGFEDAPAWYVHNLASAVDKPGAGAEFLHRAEMKARELKKQFLRLVGPEQKKLMRIMKKRVFYMLVSARNPSTKEHFGKRSYKTDKKHFPGVGPGFFTN